MKNKPITLEVCIDSVAGAMAAEQGGADRVELCANLLEGGTTPSTGMVRSVLAATSLPVMVMIRPRGGHFCYSGQERVVMISEARAVLDEPVAGIVIGALDSSGQIDRPLCEQLCALADGRSVTFHRAFDQTVDAQQALETLASLPVDRILTSGQAPGAVLGVELIRKLVRQAADRLVIMPGCGVRADNVVSIVQQTGAREVHCSASVRVGRPVAFWRHQVPMSAAQPPDDLYGRVTSTDQVQSIVARLSDHAG